MRELPGGVTISRDSFGVPTIAGPTDSSVAFGLGYAQAEDNLAHIEDSFLRALGRGAEEHGQDAVVEDFLVAALDIPRLAQLEYRRAPPHMRRLYDGYAAGLNFYVASRHSGRSSRIASFAPWFPLALIRYKYHVLEFIGYSGVDPGSLAISDHEVDAPQGSNAWALAPRHTQDGAALLFINPHVSFFGPARYYEARVISAEGWRFAGVGRYGFPLLYMGHNSSLGWAHTDNYPDIGDLYIEHFDDPSRPLAYRYGRGWRIARETMHDVQVGEADRQQIRRFRIIRTHHGPVITTFNGHPLSIRLARLEDGGWFDQWFAMSKARTFTAFRRALSQTAVPYMNIVYADNAGNIFYAYNGAVPRRDRRFNFDQPVDGADPRTEWRGYHRFADLPQIANPESGYLLSTNSSPFVATSPMPLRRSDYPDYMIGGEFDNPRAQVSNSILREMERVSFDAWASAATDTRVGEAERLVPELLAAFPAYQQTYPGDAALIAPLVAELEAWDRRSETDSIAMTLFAHWHALMRAQDMPAAADTRFELLNQTRNELEMVWHDWRVAWGHVNRLQRPAGDDVNRFDDERPSLPVRGASGRLGIVFNFYTRTLASGRAYGWMGNSYVSVVALSAEAARSRSIMYFGQNADPASPHFFDQAPLYARGEFRPEERLH